MKGSMIRKVNLQGKENPRCFQSIKEELFGLSVMLENGVAHSQSLQFSSRAV